MNKDTILTLLQHAQSGLQTTFEAVPDDKLLWKPLENGRTVLDLFSEAAQTTGMAARLIQSRGEEKPSRELFGQMKQERAAWTKETALREMEIHAAALLAAIEGCTEEELARSVSLPLGGGITMALGGWTMLAYRSFISRFAQINYIQTLYGDFDPH